MKSKVKLIVLIMIVVLLTYLYMSTNILEILISNIFMLGFLILVISFPYLCWQLLFDPKLYSRNDFYLRNDKKTGKYVLDYKKFSFDILRENLENPNSPVIVTDYNNFLPRDLYGKRVRKTIAKRVENYLISNKEDINNKILINNNKKDSEQEINYTNSNTIEYSDKYNKKVLLIGIMLFLVVLFFIGSWFIWEVMSDDFKLVACPIILGLGILEVIVGAFIVVNPYFQNFKDFEIKEYIINDQKVINIKYKDHEFEFWDRFDIKDLEKAEKNRKHISELNKYRIKFFYKYALLNILNKPMDLENLEQYESVRKAANYEILEYRNLLERKKMTIELKDIGEIFIFEGKELLYKKSDVGRLPDKFCLYGDGNGNYINKWLWNGVASSLDFSFQEFPRYTSETQKIYIIKNNNVIIVDTLINIELFG